MGKEKTKKQLITEIKALRKQILKYRNLDHQRNKAKDVSPESDKNVLHNLYERIKELNCLYGLSKLVEKPNISLERIFQGMVNLFPPSWQYPDITRARILFQDKEFKTSNFKETKWRQSANIKAFGKKVGFVEVLYLKEKPDCYEGPFLKDERLLIDAVAQRLGKIVERKTMEEALKKSEAILLEQKRSLERKNIALREIVAQIEVEKNNIRNDIMSNLNESAFPILEKLKTQKNIHKYIGLLQYHLKELTSSFGSKITKRSIKLTPREIEICNMIKGNLTSKEISGLLNISRQTVERHRKNIRKKLKLSNKRFNLASFLQQL